MKLPKSTWEPVSLRAGRINGCGRCVDTHVKDAAAAGESAVRLAAAPLADGRASRRPRPSPPSPAHLEP